MAISIDEMSSAEIDRINALRAYDILDTPPEEAFDELARLAASIFDAPIALVSLIDEHRQWFKAKIGVTAQETPRNIAFCTQTIRSHDLLIVPDTLEDKRFADHPLVVSDPLIRFYAGAPLITPGGYALGALCVIDRVPRQISIQHKQALQILSRHVMAQMELRRRVIELARVNAERDQAVVALSQARDKLDSLVREQETKIARLSRIHAVLSGIRTAIFPIRQREQLLSEVCRIAVEHGKFRMAWTALLEPMTLEGKLVAWVGADEDYMKKVVVSARPNTDYAERPANRALRTGKPVVCNDIASDPGMAVVRNDALVRGYHSVIALPLLVAHKPVGVIALYAMEPDFFDQEELKLLVDLATEVSFALEYIAQEERINYLASYSVQTGLPNLTLCQDRLGQYIRTAEHNQAALALLIIDLERFRIVNDTLGRQTGEDLLMLFGERLAKVIGNSNRVAHLGIDRFAVIVTDVKDASDIAHTLEREIVPALTQPFVLSGEELRISVKTGIAVFPADGGDAEAILRNAEAALQKAKALGDRYLFYSPDINTRIAGTLTLETKLRRAIEEQQFVLHYQPKMDSQTGRVSGLEALIRWNDPETGLVPPYRFIPLLEETGMILEVGRWVLTQAALVYESWLDRGLPSPRIAVNVSPLQLRRKDFVAEIEKVALTSGKGIAGLDIEITEGVFMDQMEPTIEKLRAIREMGLRVAIDDFGTGYSSLRYIARLPIDTLKVDQSFITAMTQSPDDMAIVATIISLAHGLDLSVIAEGVETQEQRNLLRLLRCDEMQGYLFSRPIPLDKIEAMLATT